MTQPHKAFAVPLANDRRLGLGPTPLVMGILNVTPDSFSDGGDHFALSDAVAAAQRMAEEGATIIDVGGESTRPGGEPTPLQTELDRVMPALDALAENELAALISIDTRHALVADQAIQAGAHILNDVEGLQMEPEMADVAAAHHVPVIAMHWDRQRDTGKDVIAEMTRFFEKTVAIADKAGVPNEKLILDPGFGFAKSMAENYEILRRLPELAALGFPLLSGTSRKSMIGKLLGNEPKERLAGTIATSTLAYLGGAHIFRVHDVRANSDALRVAQATLYGPAQKEG